MTDALAIITVIVICSTIVFGVQMFAWFITLGRFCRYADARRSLIGALIVFPAFVLLMQCFRLFFGYSSSAGEFVLMPVVTAWIVLLCLGALRVAAHLKRHRLTK